MMATATCVVCKSPLRECRCGEDLIRMRAAFMGKFETMTLRPPANIHRGDIISVAGVPRKVYVAVIVADKMHLEVGPLTFGSDIVPEHMLEFEDAPKPEKPA